MRRYKPRNSEAEGFGGALWLIVLLALALFLVLVALSCLGCAVTDEANAGKAEATVAEEEVSASLADFRKTIEAAAERVEGDQNAGTLSGGAPYLLAVSFAALWLVGNVQKRALAAVVRVLMRSIEDAPGGAAVKRTVSRKARAAHLSRRVDQLKRSLVDR